MISLVALEQINEGVVGTIAEGQEFSANETHANQLIETGKAVKSGTRLFWPALPWRGNCVVIIASGPSLAVEDCVKVHQWKDEQPDVRKVIVVNTSYKLVRWADILYACDGRWWGEYHDQAFEEFEGALWTQDEAASHKYPYINFVRSEAGMGLNKKVGVINQGANSGYQAIGLAYQGGVEKMILLGFDCQESGGRLHWHPDHPARLHTFPQYTLWMQNFERLAKDLRGMGVEVINATRETALTCFRQKPLEEVLQ